MHFFIAYYSKLLQILREDLQRLCNGDEPVQTSAFFNNFEDLREFFKFDFELLRYYPDISKEPFIIQQSSTECLLIALLNLLAEYFSSNHISLLLKFAENLSNLFLQVRLFSHAVMCQCFIIQMDPDPESLETNMTILEEKYEKKTRNRKIIFLLVTFALHEGPLYSTHRARIKPNKNEF